jgi:ABC-2 type transport system ATP-binding protein
VSLRFDRREQFAAARLEIGALPEVAELEADERELKLTAVPREGKNALPAVSTLITQRDWDVPELHLESGRLDEVFRRLTRPSASLHDALAPTPGSEATEGGAQP